jgi:hypothetical protein
VVTYRITGVEHPVDAWLPSATDDGWDTLALDETTGLPKDNQQPATGILYWVDGRYAQTRHLDTDRTAFPLENLVGEMRAAEVPLDAPAGFQPIYGDIPFGPGWAAILLGFGGILLVYRPTRVTRWGWLWLTGLVPFGLGLVALAAGELVRPSRRPLAPETLVAQETTDLPETTDPPERSGEGRLRGGRAFLLALVLNLLVSVTAGHLSRSVDALWVP